MKILWIRTVEWKTAFDTFDYLSNKVWGKTAFASTFRAMFLLHALIILTLLIGDQTCWHGWDAKEDSCYKMYNEKKSRADSQAVCKAERGDLAKLNSEDKNYFVFLNLVKLANPRSSVWMGLSRGSDNKFYWPDGGLTEYTNWSPGSPDNSPGNKKNCTKINEFTGLWENEEFDFTYSFVCGRGKWVHDIIKYALLCRLNRFVIECRKQFNTQVSGGIASILFVIALEKKLASPFRPISNKQNQSWPACTHFPALRASFIYMLRALVGSLCFLRLSWLAKRRSLNQ